MKQSLFVFVLFLLTSTFVKSQNLQSYMASAREAYKIKDNKKFYEMILEAHKLHPYHQGILYQAGLAAALNDQPTEAIGYLAKAIQINSQYDLEVADLTSLQNLPAFQNLKKIQTELQQPILHSDTAFVVHQKNLHIESIAQGEKQGVFYLGSIHKRKIVRTDDKGNTSDFTTSAQDGLTSVFGVRVDAKKNVLWACASPMPEMENFDTTTWSAVFKYDLKTKKLITKFLTSEKQDNAFGDMTLDSKGNPYISDSKTATIFTVDEKSRKLVPFFSSDEFWSIQGITFSDDQKYLFIADYIKGIFRLKLDDKSLLLLPAKFDASLKAIDGMTFYKNSLVAIQNMVVPMRSSVYHLNANLDELIACEIIDRAHPAFNEPTIGCIANDTFYYVGNSLWSGYTKDQKLKPENELQDVVILKADLKKLK
jgi:sugar lactone lactonase YvrE